MTGRRSRKQLDSSPGRGKSLIYWQIITQHHFQRWTRSMAIEDQQEEKDNTRRHWLEHQHLHCVYLKHLSTQKVITTAPNRIKEVRILTRSLYI
jgi:hypothetical protein